MPISFMDLIYVQVPNASNDMSCLLASPPLTPALSFLLVPTLAFGLKPVPTLSSYPASLFHSQTAEFLKEQATQVAPNLLSKTAYRTPHRLHCDLTPSSPSLPPPSLPLSALPFPRVFFSFVPGCCTGHPYASWLWHLLLPLPGAPHSSPTCSHLKVSHLSQTVAQLPCAYCASDGSSSLCHVFLSPMQPFPPGIHLF